MQVSNPTIPKKNVKNIINTRHDRADSRVIVDFKAFPKWMHSIRCDDFTNEFTSIEECSEHLFKLLSKLFPYIQEENKKIFTGAGHCHTITDPKKKGKKNKDNKPRSKVEKIVKKLHDIDLDPETEVWQLSYGEGIRLVAVLISKGEDIILYPLFIDQHHIIYPDKHNNQSDLSAESCCIQPQKMFY